MTTTVDLTSSKHVDWRTTYSERYYLSKPGWKDPHEEWWELIASHLKGNGTVLEIGGGPVPDLTRRLRPLASRLIGLDVDPVIRTNTFLDTAVVYDGGAFEGIRHGEVDVAVSDWVNEHITNPAEHFGEVSRVLKDGGVYIFRTVNRFHYKALGAQVVPHRVQVPVVRWLKQTAEEDYDPYTVYYRANSRRRIQRLCARAGLKVESYDMVEPLPRYGFGARPLFFLFMAYERLVNWSPLFEPLRHTIHCVARKSQGLASGL